MGCVQYWGSFKYRRGTTPCGVRGVRTEFWGCHEHSFAFLNRSRLSTDHIFYLFDMTLSILNVIFIAFAIFIEEDCFFLISVGFFWACVSLACSGWLPNTSVSSST